MNLSELAQRATPFAALQQRMLDDERRIRDLVESPALRLARECEATHRKHIAEFQDYARCRAAEALRIQELLAPSRLFAQQYAFERTRMAELAQLWKSPLEDLTRKLTEMHDLGAVYRRINETAVARMQEVDRAVAVAKTHAAMFPTLGVISRQLQETTSAILKSVLPLAAEDYGRVAAGFEAYASKIGIAASATFTHIPQRELFVTADLLAAWSGRAIARTDIEVEPRVIRRRIDVFVYETLDEALTDFAPTLLPALAGAREIAVTDNPEKIRYACVSLRTVSIGILELLAPTQQVKEWSSRPRDFFNGHPRTLTRLRFIAQRVDSPELSKFIEADSQAISQLIDVLHAGTHEFSLNLTQRQLRYVFRRVESFLCALLEATIG